MKGFYIRPKYTVSNSKILAENSQDKAAQVILKKQKNAKDKIDAIREKKMLDNLFVV